MPERRVNFTPEHRRYAEWTPSRIIQWAGKTGTATAQVVEKILGARTYPEQGYRSCLGILHLSHHYSSDRVEAAARRALEFNTCSYKSMKAILVAGLDREAIPDKKPLQMSLPLHENVRGREYYR